MGKRHGSCWFITENTEGHVELSTMEDRHGQYLTHFTFKNTIKRKTAKEKKGRKKPEDILFDCTFLSL